MTVYPELLLAVIAAPDAAAKGALLAQIRAPETTGWTVPPLPLRPGRPAHYVESDQPPRRRKTLKHRPTLLRFLHAIHHIELSAIDLACAASLGGPDMPTAFHADQVAVAREEAGHAALVEAFLVANAFPPGSDPVHHRLWEAARACADLGDLLVVIPRFLEARGLDVSADLLPRLAAIDPGAQAIIARIYADEVGHVGIGTRWHRFWCQERGLDPEVHFRAVAQRHFADQIPGPFPLDRPGRVQAGFSDADLDFLVRPRPTQDLGPRT